MDKDTLKSPTSERNPCGEVGIKQSEHENDKPSPYEAYSSTKIAKKRQEDKKAAFEANYGKFPAQKTQKAAKKALERLQELQGSYEFKPVSEAEDLDLPSPQPARKKSEPNAAFKRKQHGKRVDTILDNQEKKRIRGHIRNIVDNDEYIDEEEEMWNSWRDN